MKFLNPVHNMGNRQLIPNKCPILLQPVCGENFEGIIFKSLYKFIK